MKQLTIAAVALAALAMPAFADDKLSDAEAEKAVAAAKAWGCEGGTWEKESEGSGIFELDDAKCADGENYDLKFDSEYSLIAITKD